MWIKKNSIGTSRGADDPRCSTATHGVAGERHAASVGIPNAVTHATHGLLVAATPQGSSLCQEVPNMYLSFRIMGTVGVGTHAQASFDTV